MSLNTLEELKKGALNGATRLKLSEKLETFPEEIYDLADTLEILDLTGNQLSSLPESFTCLKKLKILFLSNNRFEVLPEVLGQCENLEMIGFKANQIVQVPENALPPKTRWLILTDNRIEVLPESIGNLSRLQKCMLAGNCLQILPESMANCQNLELLRISANQLQEIPKWLTAMPKLSWLALAGNPATKQPSINPAQEEQESSLPVFKIEDFEVYDVLGEGASGVISQASWNDASKQHCDEVAVKIFKGQVTSDGYPEDELQASLLAGQHANLVSVIGELSGKGQHGLVMKLIPSDFKNLGLPPTLQSCTRDVFKEGFCLTSDQAYKIALSMANVLAHLHEKGIMHGDAYAHNTLVDEQWNVLFGDFGAATIYNDSELTAEQQAQLQSIEVRAWGCLLDDLLSCVKEDKQKPLINMLEKLANDCLVSQWQNRPTFLQVISELSSFNIAD